ncbi:hypothetical protein E4T50_01111, partial [Aureobasidium sp. EXF-12298]
DRRVVPIIRCTHPRLRDVDQWRSTCADLYVRDLSRVLVSGLECWTIETVVLVTESGGGAVWSALRAMPLFSSELSCTPPSPQWTPATLHMDLQDLESAREI